MFFTLLSMVTMIQPSQLEEFVYKRKVWFVDNSVAEVGDGSHARPFTTLSAAQASSAEGDVIYVFAGDGTSQGLDQGVILKRGQKILGGGRHHSLITEDGKVVVQASGVNFPKITNSQGLPAITLADGCEVAGLHITDIVAPSAILGTDLHGISPPFFGVKDCFIHHNLIDDCKLTKGAITLFNCSGSLTIMHNVIAHIQGSGIEITDDLVPVHAEHKIAHNSLRHLHHGITMLHHSPGGHIRALLVGNHLEACGESCLGAKKRVALGTFSAVIKDNTFCKNTSYGLELISCGGLTLQADVSNNCFQGNPLGSLLAHSFNKSALHLTLNDNVADHSFFLSQEGKQAKLICDSAQGNTGEIQRIK